MLKSSYLFHISMPFIFQLKEGIVVKFKSYKKNFVLSLVEKTYVKLKRTKKRFTPIFK